MIIFIIAAWGGQNGGIIAGLATATIMGVVVGSAADLMQDFKTGAPRMRLQLAAAAKLASATAAAAAAAAGPLARA